MYFWIPCLAWFDHLWSLFVSFLLFTAIHSRMNTSIYTKHLMYNNYQNGFIYHFNRCPNNVVVFQTKFITITLNNNCKICVSISSGSSFGRAAICSNVAPKHGNVHARSHCTRQCFFITLCHDALLTCHLCRPSGRFLLTSEILNFSEQDFATC